MHDDRYAAIAAAIDKQAAAEQVPIRIAHVCQACAQMVGADGVSFCTAGDLGAAEPVYATDADSERAVELEVTLGQGPGVQALETGAEVLVGDLASRSSCGQWPVLAPLVTALGVRAMFALPLASGDVTAGVLALYRRHPQALSDDELTDGRACAGYALALLVGATYDSFGLELDGVLAGSLAQQWALVYQAVGVVSAQLHIGLRPAYQRLRAHAFVTDCPLREVAHAVLTSSLRFTRW